MNKKEYLELLKYHLKGLPKEEIDDIISDYEEYFQIGTEKGRSEKAIARSLGYPKSIAKQFKADYFVRRAESVPSPNNMTNAVLAAAGLGLFNFFFVLGPFLSVFVLIFGLLIAGVAITGAGFAALVLSVMAPMGLLHSVHFGIPALTGFFAGLGLVCMGFLWLIGMYYITKVFYIVTIKYLKFNIKLIKQEEI